MIKKSDIYNTCTKLQNSDGGNDDSVNMFVSVFETLTDYYDNNYKQMRHIINSIEENSNLSYEVLKNQHIKIDNKSINNQHPSYINQKQEIELLQDEYNQLVYKNNEIIRNLANINNFVLSHYGEQYMNGVVPAIENAGSNILEAQEKERSRIACDLHDTIIQNLTNLVHKSELCIKIIDYDVIEVKLELQIMIQTIRSVINDIRGIVYNLRPMSMEDLGLSIAIKRFLENFEKENNISIEYSIDETVDSISNSIISLTFFRIIQEACSNAFRHGGASNIYVSLSYAHDMVYLKVKDDGMGFVVKDKLNQTKDCQRESNTGFGLSIMKERVYLLSGYISIDSVLNKGTEIMVQVPVSRCKEEL